MDLSSHLSVDWQSPINYNHDLNRGLTAWWLTVPHWRWGVLGGTFNRINALRDLTGRHHGKMDFLGYSSSNGVSSPPGGWDSIFNNGAASRRVEVANNASLIFGLNDFTMFASVLLKDLSTRLVAMAKDTFGGTSWAWFFNTTPDAMRFATNSDFSTNAATPMVINRWYRIAVARRGDGISYYLDGKLDGSNATYFSGIPSMTSTADLIMGDGPLNEMNGARDNVKIYNGRGMSDAEVYAEYEETVTYNPGLLRRIRTPVVGIAAAPPASNIFRKSLTGTRRGTRTAV